MSEQPAPDTAVPGTAAAQAAPTYRERLWPGPLGWALVPAAAALAAIAFWPMHPVASAVGAVAAFATALVAAWRLAVVVEVAGGELRVGAARIPVAALGAPVPLDRAGMRQALGPGSDARAWVCLRAWVPGGVQVPVTDPTDPTPAWIVSTRRPQALASAVERAQAHSEQTIRPSFS